MSKLIKYERTWCDYLTPCPYKEEEYPGRVKMVGSYECACECKHCKMFNNDIVECNHG